jgi:putative ABC transport system permease protein
MTTADPRGSPLRIIEALVSLHPPSFRRRYGDGVIAFCTERVVTARARGESPLRAWTRVVADLSISALVEWGRLPHFRSGARMNALLKEFTLALRSLRKNPVFSGASIATLALGIGATTASFSVIYTVLLRPMPFPEPSRVVVPQTVRIGGESGSYMSYADFMDWRDNRIFDKVAVFQPIDMDLASDGEPVRVSSATVGPEFFAAIGAVPQRGRVFDARDYPVAADRAVVISDRLWRTRFGSRDDIIGLEVDVNSIRRPIVGVLPPGLEWPIDVDLWVRTV